MIRFSTKSLRLSGRPIIQPLDLPDTMTVDAQTGAITGTFPNAGIFNIEISAANSGGTDTRTLVVAVLASGPLNTFAWSTSPLPKEAGEPFPVTFAQWISRPDGTGFQRFHGASRQFRCSHRERHPIVELPLGNILS